MEFERVKTGVAGLDTIAHGGIIRGKVTLVAGTTGSGKTILGAQFLAAGASVGEGVVFVTFEEPADELRLSLKAFGWDVLKFEQQGVWRWVDCSPREEAAHPEYANEEYDFSALLARIEHAVKAINAKRVVIDSLNALLMRFSNGKHIRNDMLQLALMLRQLAVTSIITTERSDDYGPVSETKIIEFIVDCVVILRNVLEREKRRRTVEILKFRGGGHIKGEFPFGILPDQGVVAHPLAGIQLSQKSSTERISCGIHALDEMCGGGFFQDSIVLAAGATGTGKTLISTHFLGADLDRKDRRLLIAFEESKDQLFRNASSWGIPLHELEEQGLLKVHCVYPEVEGIEEHLINIHQLVEEFDPRRVAIDSLSAVERVGSVKGFQEFVISITAMLKKHEICALYTAATPSLMGATMIANGNISTIADSIILLRYVEIKGKMRRGIAVLKMRGSSHDVDVREVLIDGNGMNIGPPFEGVDGILSGQPTYFGHRKLETSD